MKPKPVPQQISAPMRIIDMVLTQTLSSSPEVCLCRIVSRSDGLSPSKRRMKTPRAINMLPLNVAQFLPARIDLSFYEEAS